MYSIFVWSIVYTGQSLKIKFKNMAGNSRGILKFNGGEGQKLLKLNYSVSRSTDVSGRVASDPSNALIKVTIEATEKSDVLESLLNSKYKPTKEKLLSINLMKKEH
jgi:hypothetical protein